MTVQAVSPEREDWLVGVMAETSPVAAAAMNSQQWVPPGDEFRLPPNSLAVLGTADPIGDMGSTAELVGSWGSEVRWIEGCGHVPFLEEPEEFSEVLRTWLKNVEGN